MLLLVRLAINKDYMILSNNFLKKILEKNNELNVF
jgi:hypothetical protein